MRNIITSILLASTTSLLYADQNDLKYFIGSGVDISKLDISKKDDTNIVKKDLDDTTIGFNLQGGVIIKQNYILLANYEYLSLDDIDSSNYYLSLDYKFNYKFNPYIGLSLGVSDIKWKIDPIINTTSKDNQQSSTLFGIQTGTIHNLLDQWSLYTKVAYQFYDHKTQLISTPAQATINHKDKFSLGVGVRYRF